MASPKPNRKSFVVRDCALSAIATGRKAQNLKELHNHLLGVDPDSIYYHFWGGLLRPRFDDPEFNNDFAAWAKHALHDTPLAERLGIIDPTDFSDLEELRQELIEVIEERLDESEIISWSKADQQFYFIRSQTIVLNTNKIIRRPRELADEVPHMSVSSIFFHVIDARRRYRTGFDDFRNWLSDMGSEHSELCDRLAAVDPYFGSLSQLRANLSDLFQSYFRENP